jgi:hypothetical protein
MEDKMFKDLLDYNGKVNTWGRENRTEAIGYGLVLNAIVFVVIGVIIRKEYKKEMK